MIPIALNQDEQEAVLIRINQPDPKQAARIVAYLAENPETPTVVINSKCSVGNISDQVQKIINPRIQDLGLMVACQKPVTPIYNKFKQPSGQHLWSFYRLPDAANDPAYDIDQ